MLYVKFPVFHSVWPGQNHIISKKIKIARNLACCGNILIYMKKKRMPSGPTVQTTYTSSRLKSQAKEKESEVIQVI
jgi:hypothetical protein